MAAELKHYLVRRVEYHYVAATSEEEAIEETEDTEEYYRNVMGHDFTVWPEDVTANPESPLDAAIERLIANY